MVTPLLQELLKQLVPQYANFGQTSRTKTHAIQARMESERSVQEVGGKEEVVAPDFESLSNEIAAEFEKDPNFYFGRQVSPQGKILAIRFAYDRVKARLKDL